MARQFTGLDGSLYVGNEKIGTISGWTFNATADVLDTTTLGKFAKTAVYGVQSFTGSCTMFYYEGAGGAITGKNLLNDTIRTSATPVEPTKTLKLRYSNGAKVHEVTFKCLLNSVTVSAVAGGIATAEVSFTVDGPLTAASLAV